jgi:repressor LexA
MPERLFDVKPKSNRCLIGPVSTGTVLGTGRKRPGGALSEESMDTITARQRRILDFISRTVRERGYPPTVREIGEAVGLHSSSSVHAQLANLERLGVLKRDPSRPRAMELQGPSHGRARAASVPLLGKVPAGSPTLAAEDVEDYLAVPAEWAGEESLYALRVEGASMRGAGILDGDLVVVRPEASASDGDVVVALMPGPAELEATVKRLARGTDGAPMLMPENDAFDPFPLGEGEVVGRVVGLLRKL